ncbi:winged helix-turn-helix domain-containing protein [Patescibacteria group bacterium]|nr:winged helix-turn-helix domain-containing protein [Patescibacteria group bacterium]MBU4023231.1 winged helix-turn-helix domain-containing protein [Patescibacteria group bacterium]MBU4078425.1 winged helix-turn-helix domain-containing protein [Patescibacteria group bacterium]
MTTKNFLSKTEAAYKILKEKKSPLDVKEIIKIALERNLITTKGKTPHSTLRVDIYLENKRRKKQKKGLRFCQERSAIWGLCEWKK